MTEIIQLSTVIGGDGAHPTSTRSCLSNSFRWPMRRATTQPIRRMARGALTVSSWRSPISSRAPSRPLTQTVRMAIRAPKTKKGPKGKDPRLWFSRPMATANAAMLHATSTPVTSAVSPNQAR